MSLPSQDPELVRALLARADMAHALATTRGLAPDDDDGIAEAVMDQSLDELVSDWLAETLPVPRETTHQTNRPSSDER